MEYYVNEDITGELYDMYVVWHLDNLRKQYANILEVTYLPDFVDVETLDNVINPKYIIRDMLITYLRSVCDIYKQPGLLHELIFMFHEENGDIRNFQFSNNMMFSDDIITICFLYYILSHPQIKHCETVQSLLSLMKNKYGMSFETRINNTKSTQKQNRITMYAVGFSYPSMMWDTANDLEMYNYLLKQYCTDFDLPESFLSLFFLPSFNIIFPTLNQAYPFAIVMIIALKSLEDTHPKECNIISLRKVLNDISVIYNRQIFPEHLKLELCKKWQIVVLKEGTYIYTPSFTAFCQKAKNVIAMSKSNDPDLEFVLSQL